MARPKVYKIELTQEERDNLDKTIKNKNTCKTVLKRCQILRDLDETQGTTLTHEQLAHIYAVSKATVNNTIKAYIAKGISEIITYHISPNSARSIRKSDGRVEAQLIQLACSEVPEGHSRWTISLLEEKSRIILDTPISGETIRRILKKTNFDLTATTTGVSHQNKMLNS